NHSGSSRGRGQHLKSITFRYSRRFTTCRGRGIADGVDIGLVGATLEYARPGHEHIGSGTHDARRVLGGHSAIDLNIDGPAADQRTQMIDLVERGRDEGLTAESRIDRHDKNEVDEIENVLDRGDRRARIDAYTGPFAQGADRL